MDSKKKPLFLVFENADPGADDVYILFKNGDGDILYFAFVLFCFVSYLLLAERWNIID